VFGNSVYYRFRQHGFTLGAREPLRRIGSAPEWTRYVTDTFVDELFAFDSDLADLYAIGEAPVNHISPPTLVKEALIDAYGPMAVTPVPGDPGCFTLTLDDDLRDLLGDRLELFIRALRENARLIVNST
jgi:hypothetical protein